jgi:divalent metal cation (Fe/Co/Zn/Cd) transporter
MNQRVVAYGEASTMNHSRERLYRAAFGLAIFTIVYNFVEAGVAIVFGLHDTNLTLFGFGVDSLIEVISGIGIAHMVVRIRANALTTKDKFENTALRITGVSFYLLAVGLIAASTLRLISGGRPETTLVGVILSLISIAVMLALMYAKLSVGKRLNSAPIIADAHCTKVCVYMSVVLLIASAMYELTTIGYVDILGSLGLAYVSFNEGSESLAKARSRTPDRDQDE